MRFLNEKDSPNAEVVGVEEEELFSETEEEQPVEVESRKRKKSASVKLFLFFHFLCSLFWRLIDYKRGALLQKDHEFRLLDESNDEKENRWREYFLCFIIYTFLCLKTRISKKINKYLGKNKNITSC